MSGNISVKGPAAGLLPQLPTGTEVASYRTYPQAQAAVDKISDMDIDVRGVTIVGTDLRQVERVTGRLTIWKVLGRAALSGIWMGLLFSLLIYLWMPNRTPLILVAGIALGVIFYTAMSVIPYLLSKGKRDFTSVTQIVAGRYMLLATIEAGRIREILADSPGNLTREPEPEPATQTGPTAFGSRPDEQPRYGVRLSDAQKAAASQQAGEQAGEQANSQQAGQQPGQQPGQQAGQQPGSPAPQQHHPRHAKPADESEPPTQPGTDSASTPAEPAEPTEPAPEREHTDE
ncbi:hypothetical protein QS713_04360 [Gleimia hominis]|uniref:General stress protein 17M-like domain-containing protein n=1 Tax=Gleimia hominis TaxID=595468 RepID=A0ABU3IBK3_9ACTO|nr:general stress protein [Gleimia hominis]MDT3767301.1 hypothetical protein [Gleimia hominis]